MTKIDAYRAAGVDIDAGIEAARRYARLAARTRRPEVLGGIGGFAGGFCLDTAQYREPVLVSGADGVGTKLKIAIATGIHDTIGIDCVAMCVNDILTMGAEPLFFLDYLAVGKLDVDVAEAVVSGVAAGCEQAGCALVGGETAEMPGMYEPGEYDLAGFAVGVIDKARIIDGRSVQPGDVLIGLASNGLHANGYSLVRKLVAEAGLAWDDAPHGWRGTVAEELLRPTRIYVRPILKLLSDGVPVRAMAHLTGGGWPENLPRVLPEGMTAVIRRGSWPVPAVFEWLMERARLSFEEAARIWNMGIGLVLAVPADAAEDTVGRLAGEGENAYVVGHVEAGPGGVRWEGSR
jgi:phosphoribosylformylglycinamidine cyclo-ligase